MKTIVLDFDGIFSTNMIYTKEGKFAKTLPFGIRHAFEILNEYGFEIHVITGDSTKNGQNITKAFLSTVPIKSLIYCPCKNKLRFLKRKFNINEIIYSGDDIYDIEILKNVGFSYVPSNVNEILKQYADSVINCSVNDYYFFEMAIRIITRFRYDNDYDIDWCESFVKETTQEPLTDYLIDKRFNNILILQQYSMRNHSDCKYNLLLDGNLNFTLHRIYNVIHINKKLNIVITMPNHYDQSQYEKLKSFVDLNFDNRVEFLKVKYGKNAQENRKIMKKFKYDYVFDDIDSYDLIISDFTEVDVLKKFQNIRHKEIIYNFNISKVDALDRPYIDEFFNEHLQTCCLTNSFVYVLNNNQKETFINESTSQNSVLSVESNVIVDNKTINHKLFNKQLEFFTRNNELRNKILNYVNFKKQSVDHIIFFPFRITDERYKFSLLLDKLSELDKNLCILIMNPNDSKLLQVPNNCKIYDLGSIFSNECKKEIYFNILKIIAKNRKMFIYIYEDIEEVLHQSLIEIALLAPNNTKFLKENNKLDFIPSTETNKQIVKKYTYK